MAKRLLILVFAIVLCVGQVRMVVCMQETIGESLAQPLLQSVVIEVPQPNPLKNRLKTMRHLCEEFQSCVCITTLISLVGIPAGIAIWAWQQSLN